MNTDRMPVVFAGHGSPLNAIGDNRARQGWRAAGQHIVENYGKPSAILAVSAHWQARGSFHVHTDFVNPQIMDMWGFPEELYQVHYQPDGDNEVARRVLGLLGDRATTDHFLPLPVALGAAQAGDTVATFNNYRELGSMSMTSYIFG